jgi:hypothetical protein
LYHLYGDKDRSHRLGLIAPGRWPIFPASAWNRARRQGRVSEINIGPMGHTGRGGYLDAKHTLPDGMQYVDSTVQVISQIVLQTATTLPGPASPQAQPDGHAALMSLSRPAY